MKEFKLENIEKIFTLKTNSVKVFSGLNLEIETGEFVSLMGPSGSGKSTILNILGGVDQPTSGLVMHQDNVISQMTSSQLTRWRRDSIGFIFQSYNLMKNLTAYTNVELPLLLLKMTKKERRYRVENVLDLVGLDLRKKHKPCELSGGQQQRVAIARALVSDPNVLLCDEPTGDLDRKSATEILEILKTLNKGSGKTVVMVTHDQVASDYADRCIVIDKGVVV